MKDLSYIIQRWSALSGLASAKVNMTDSRASAPTSHPTGPCYDCAFARFRHVLFLSLLILGCGSCTSHGPNGSIRKHYFGYTVVTFPREGGNCNSINAKEIKNFGFAAGLPLFVSVGFLKEKRVALPPDCRLFIEVQTDKQFEEAIQLAKQLNNLQICVIQSTHPRESTNALAASSAQ